ncbi:MAG TPA: hypothetical protein VHT51_18780, partial [Micropepsaceae bacterium]|nr:hypothetical protein [Micropepsaceae bacterium]
MQRKYWPRMTDLKKLKVSLTKHGAHKISRLLKRFDPDKVLDNATGEVEGINIDRTQAAVIMSARRDGSIPNLWSDVKALGGDVVDAVIMLAIAFSHHDLIEALKHSGGRFAHGVIKRPTLDGKAFTNFKNDII